MGHQRRVTEQFFQLFEGYLASLSPGYIEHQQVIQRVDKDWHIGNEFTIIIHQPQENFSCVAFCGSGTSWMAFILRGEGWIPCQYTSPDMVRNDRHRGTSIQLRVHRLSINQYWDDQFFTSSLRIDYGKHNPGCFIHWFGHCHRFFKTMESAGFPFPLLPPCLTFSSLGCGACFSGYLHYDVAKLLASMTLCFPVKTFFRRMIGFTTTETFGKSSLHFLNIMRGTLKSWGFFFR